MHTFDHPDLSLIHPIPDALRDPAAVPSLPQVIVTGLCQGSQICSKLVASCRTEALLCIRRRLIASS